MRWWDNINRQDRGRFRVHQALGKMVVDKNACGKYSHELMSSFVVAKSHWRIWFLRDSTVSGADMKELPGSRMGKYGGLPTTPLFGEGLCMFRRC
jgi:hypothetical protein